MFNGVLVAPGILPVVDILVPFAPSAAPPPALVFEPVCDAIVVVA